MFSFKLAVHCIAVISIVLCSSVQNLVAEDSTIVPTKSLPDETVLSKIAFGSCSKQYEPQPIWKAIIAQKPQLFIYTGDNIYGDTNDMDELRAKWNQQKKKPGYNELRKSCAIMATWDDHDYGKNDAGEEFPFKKQSQQVFLDFLDVPKDSIRRKREGVYHSRVYGPIGKRVQIILLDTRYHRSPLIPSEKKVGINPEGIVGIYKPNNDPSTTILGNEQWSWLEEQLRKPAEIRVIASSIQFLANDHGFEKWGNHPHERKRMFDLIEKTRANGVIFISGDRHSGEISKFNSPLGYPIYDITSSSLTHPHPVRNELNEYRVGIIYRGINFGMMEIDWENESPEIKMQIRTGTGVNMMQVRHKVSDLAPKTNH